jgi:alpha-mannosidase/mannosylglycerate hydrolase
MKAFYCVGTHWDREWYEPFQEFRMWLVELVDELMDLMEKSPDYCCFHLDGQAVVLEDYLDIRHERRERLLEHLKSGRIIVGPWYDLPDEWLISGESYVRNLQRGRRVCREMGVEPMDFAYTPDQFGHIAALPMIMAGFGLKAGICWRGTQDETYPAQFLWIGPDGSRLATHKLLDRGSYGPFDFLVRTHIKEVGITDELFEKYFDPYLKVETERSPIPVLLMLDAIDHQRPDPLMPELMAELRKRYPDIEFKWSSLAEFGREVVAHLDKLPERKGELREPARDSARVGQYLIVHTISSRYPLKQRNDQCQTAMEKWAEPMALFQQMAGGSPILSYLDKAWQYLLKNHPHDSICGCSVDQVHRDMFYRFDQCELIADGVIRRAMAQVAKASDAVEDFVNIAVHNPLPYAGKRVVELSLPFKTDWSRKYIDGLATSETVNKFLLKDASGERIPFQITSIQRGLEWKTLRDIGRKNTAWVDVYHVAAEVDLPACGFTGIKIEETDEGTRNFGSLMTGPLSASNGLVDFELKTDGTARLLHTASGRSFDNLFMYEDCGDCGDGWTRGILMNDIVFRSPGTRVTTGIAENGPVRTVFRVEREFDLPRNMDRKTYWRAEDRNTLKVTDSIIVEKNAPFVRVRTKIVNNCEDHRFRVLFPTNITADTSFAETPFAVVERDIAIPPETGNWQERINGEKAFTTFFGVQDQDGGLAVLAPFGLHEYEVLETPDHSLALTLYRSYFKTVMTPGEKDGQLLTEMEFEYLLYPFVDSFSSAKALRHAYETQAGIRMHHVKNTAPNQTSFLNIDAGDAVVTSIKPSADGKGGVIRLWNPSGKPSATTINPLAEVKYVSLCDLEENETQNLDPIESKIIITIPPYGLSTVKFSF